MLNSSLLEVMLVNRSLRWKRNLSYAIIKLKDGTVKPSG